MLIPNSSRLRIITLGAAFGLLTGCGSSEPALPEVRVLTEAEANARTVVPLTRTVALDEPGVIADFEFDLLPPPAYTGPSLVIGIRLKEDEVRASEALNSTVAREGLPAKVLLQRLEDGKAVDMALVRRVADQRGTVPIGPDGFTPGPEHAGVNPQSLWDAGLMAEGALYNVRSFGSPGEAPPGRYRLRVELLETRPSLRTASAEIIVGYNSRAK